MKILYVITGLAQGGAERVVCDLADGMTILGHEVKIAYLTGEVLTHPVNKNIELISIELDKALSLPKAYFKLSKLIRRYNPDVVHSHMVHANIIMRIVRVMNPMTKLISTAHNSNEGGKLRMLAYRLTHHFSDTSTNVSQEATAAFEAMRAVPVNGMKTVYNGIDLNRFTYDVNAKSELAEELNVTDDYKIILAIGRFSEQKDYPNLLNAIQLFKAENETPFKLLIAGDGDLRPSIEQLINELGIEDDVILLGRRSDIPKLMSAADLFVLSSRYEGFGLVVAEAMACECLVVATDCGGVAEVLNNSEFLVSPNNPESLKEKILYSFNLEDNERDSIIYKNLRRVQNKFCLRNIIEKWVFIYNE